MNEIYIIMKIEEDMEFYKAFSTKEKAMNCAKKYIESLCFVNGWEEDIPIYYEQLEEEEMVDDILIIIEANVE